MLPKLLKDITCNSEYETGRIPWKAFLDSLLENYSGTFFVSCNCNMRDYNINSSFCGQLLQWWDDFRNAFSTLPLTAENIIWNNKICCGEKVFDPVLCKSKQFCEFLITKKGMVLRGFTKLKNDFDFDDITVSKVFLNSLSVSSETFIRSFQLKLLDDIVFTNKRLAKIGYVLHHTCKFCECPFTLLFWENFENFWFVLSGKKENSR